MSELRKALNRALEESRGMTKELLQAKKELIRAQKHILGLETEIFTLKNSVHNASVGHNAPVGQIEFADNNPFSSTYKMSL